MITLQDLRGIAQRSWGELNPAQKLAVLKKVNELELNEHNHSLVKNAEINYNKWTKTTSYNREVRKWQK